MSRVHNFSAGPAALPPEVLQQVRDDIPSWKNSGMTVMEVSHRGKDFMETAEKADQDLRDLMNIPGDYDILCTFPGHRGTMHGTMTVEN